VPYIGLTLPQIRAELKTPETARMAEAFAHQLLIKRRPLREAAAGAYADSQNIPVITYEGGEPWRFDEVVIASVFKGVMRGNAGAGK